MDPMPHILVVDDDPEIRRLLGKYLDGQGFRVSLAGSRAECETRLADSRVDLLVLDVMLPDGSGLDLCRTLRDRMPQLSVILLTALKEDVDRILGLEFGADDYLGKPFNPRELAARIRAVLRRGRSEPQPTADRRYAFAGYVADIETRTVAAPDGRLVDLTGGEFELLLVLLQRPGRILSREALLDLTQGRSADPFDRSIDILVSRLRRKLGDDSAFNILKTIRNKGYQLSVPVERGA
ncbi:response regulator transcription factor [Rhizobium sp. CC-YZS058]|uniref:response regulator transcription factor n=1 Tax=Rhizobium sp. CC-YZS058 TaxID=3042153 RepID=UPI002B06216C|nr:response regulator transcription factor [Rhizobium sp. CC-YZS058]MEA3533502.1 response regulator transcription factor [Rhizobium sp. CC-YZS058]